MNMGFPTAVTPHHLSMYTGNPPSADTFTSGESPRFILCKKLVLPSDDKFVNLEINSL